MKEQDFYTHQPLGDRLWLVQENYGVHSLNIYVLVGSENVAVIDSGMGTVTCLRDYIEQNIIGHRTMLSYATHGHIDHIGGAILFDKAFLNEGDWPDLPWALNIERRFGDMAWFSGDDAEKIAFCRTHYLHNEHVHFEPVVDGDEIALGGLTLEVIGLPGHSLGSVAYWDKENKRAFVGDALNGNCKGGPIEFAASMKAIHRFIDKVPLDTTLYEGHTVQGKGGILPYQVVIDRMHGLQEIIDGETERDVPNPLIQKIVSEETRKMKRMKHQCGMATISYDANRFTKKEEWG